MRFRKLRIAWSVFWGFACVLLIALWVRSYTSPARWYCEEKSGNSPTWRIGCIIAGGTISVFNVDLTADWLPSDHHDPAPDLFQVNGWTMESAHLWEVRTFPNSRFIEFRIWPLTLLSLMLSSAPWVSSIRRRFSLRTLLIATTLVAVVLGLAVWAASQ
jgi:hypothetical protein